MTTNLKKDPVVCARCAQREETCCRIEPGREELCFPLAPSEMNVIRDFTGSEGWFTGEANTAAFVGHLARLFSGEEELIRTIFPLNKSHFRLATRPDGKCRLLTSKGCSLPYSVRPYHCRLYPVWVSGERIAPLGGDCLAVRENRGTGRLLDGLGTTAATIRELHARLRLAWGLPPRPDMQQVCKVYSTDTK